MYKTERFIKPLACEFYMEEAATLKKLILQKLVRSDMWGGKHTPLDFIKKGVPENYKDAHKGKKIIERTLKELTTNEWIIISRKRTGVLHLDILRL